MNSGIEAPGGIEVALEAFEVGAKFRGALAAKVAILFKGFANDTLEFGRNFGIVLGDGFGRFIQNAMKNDRGGISSERLRSSSGFVQHHAEGEKIATRIEFFAARLFRRHIRDGAERTARTGEIPGRRILGSVRNRIESMRRTL